MIRTTVAVILACSLVAPVGAQVRRAARKPAVVGKAAVEPAVCKSLMADYDGASKKLALSDAEDLLDDSAARSTMREAQNGNVISQARMTLEIMKSSGCDLPTFIPSASRYGSASLSCTSAKQKIRTNVAMDRLNGRRQFYGTPTECDTTTWKPNE